MIEIKIDDRQLRQLERALAQVPRALPRVMQRSLTRAATQARTMTSRFLSKQTKLKVGVVRSQINLDKASYTKWSSGIQISRRRIRLYDLKAKQVRRGVSYVAQGGRRTVGGAFIARMQTGHTGVFKRRMAARLPIV
jgi:hypothetical protein